MDGSRQRLQRPFFSASANGFRGVISCLNAPYAVDIVAVGSGLQLIRFGQPTAPAAVESLITSRAPISNLSPAQATPTSADQALDVLVLYTEPVRQSLVALGLDPVKYMHDAVDTTQQAMVNSTATDIGQPLIAQLNFVAAKKVLYQEIGNFGADLDYLANDPEPTGLRNYWAADVVVLVTEGGILNACGQARRPNDGGLPPPGPGYAPFAHAVVKRTCTISQVVFPHEFAHTLGADHNAESEHNATPLRPWAYAHWGGAHDHVVLNILLHYAVHPGAELLQS